MSGELPGPVQKRLLRAVEPEDHEVPFARHRPQPVFAFGIRHVDEVLGANACQAHDHRRGDIGVGKEHRRA